MATCSVNGCDRDARAKGMCLKHYKRARYSPYGLAGRPPKPKCLHCDATAVAHELCPRHWKQWRLHGDALHADRRRAEAGPTRISRGYVFERGEANAARHQLITDAAIGEVVHHVNGLKADNSLGNLSVLADQPEHGRVHHSLERVAFQLVREGVIIYDYAQHEYRLAQEITSLRIA